MNIPDTHSKHHDLQKCDDRRQTLGHKGDQDRNSKRNGLFSFSLVHRRNSDDEKNDSEDDRNGRDHHNESTTEGRGQSKIEVP